MKGNKCIQIAIGETLYSVHEHLYYDKNISPAPLLEYIVVDGKVVRFVKGGYTQVVIRAEVDHVTKLYFFKTTELEKTFFRKYKDALQLAIRRTEEHERAWGWCEGKLRRNWEKEVQISEPAQLNLFDFIGGRNEQD